MTVTPKTELGAEYKGAAEQSTINIMVNMNETITGIDNHASSAAKEDGTIYNLKGQKVNSICSGQMYILNGKKYIAR